MANFTYELPSTKAFLDGVKTLVKEMPVVLYQQELIELLGSAICEFDETNQFSGKRWDANGLNIRFYLPVNLYSQYSIQLPGIESSLLKICKKVLPPSAGYDILEVSFSPNVLTDKDPLSEIKDIVEKSDFLNISEDIVEKGKRMANAYVSLYVLENHIRQYINHKLSEKVGDDYFSRINLSKRIRTGIESRKSQEQQKKWLPLRGDNDLYYLDFIELSELIINNWEFFKEHIPSQEWIKVKMEELYAIRCLIAHNSFITQDSMQMLEVTTKQLIAQIYA